MPQLSEDKQQVTAVVTKETVRRLDVQAAEQERSRSWLIARAIELYLSAQNGHGSSPQDDESPAA